MFDQLQWYDYLRLGIAALAIITLYAECHRAWRLWPQFTARVKDLWWAFNVLLLVIAYLNIEAVYLNVTYGPGLALSLLAVLVASRGVLHSRKGRDYDQVSDTYGKSSKSED